LRPRRYDILKAEDDSNKAIKDKLPMPKLSGMFQTQL
jgi:hypothetical protein